MFFVSISIGRHRVCQASHCLAFGLRYSLRA